MRKVMAILLSIAITVIYSYPTFADENYGETIVVDYEDIEDEIEENVDNSSNEDEEITEIQEEYSTIEEIEETTVDNLDDELVEDMSKINEIIENNRNNVYEEDITEEDTKLLETTTEVITELSTEYTTEIFEETTDDSIVEFSKNGGKSGINNINSIGIFTVIINGKSVECNSLKDAFAVANHNNATIILNNSYYVDNNDIDTSNPYINYGVNCPYISGNDTNITLISNEKSSIIRSIEESEIKNILCVLDGAVLNIENIVLDGGFEYDTNNMELSPYINDVDKSSTYGPLILLQQGSINLNNNTTLTRNYYTCKENYKSRYALIDTIKSGNTDDTFVGGKSKVVLNGAEITQNYGQGLICANNGMEVFLNSGSIYFNESINRANWDSTSYNGTLKLEDSSENLVFSEDCNMQIRSNKNYDYQQNITQTLADIYACCDIDLNGRCEIGELAIANYNINVNCLPSNQHKNSIAIYILGYSFDTATNQGNHLNINVDKYRNEYYDNPNFDPNIVIKLNNHYYKAKSKRVTGYENGKEIYGNYVQDKGEIIQTKFTSVYRDTLVYRENNEITEDKARYGMVAVGSFKWGYTDATSQNTMQSAYNLIGFDVAIDFDKPDSNTPYAYISTDEAFYKGIYWNGEGTGDDNMEEPNNYSIENPISYKAVHAYNYSNVINSDVEDFDMFGGEGWGSLHCAKFGIEIKNIPANKKLWIRKRYIGSDRNQNAFVTDWMFLDTPSLYTVAID